MSSFSVLTIVKGRRNHLNHLLRGVAKSDTPPAEVIVVHMNQPTDEGLYDPGVPLRQFRLDRPDDPLPLARARNMAASRAQKDAFVFLDVDCIPGPGLFRKLSRAALRTHGLVMGTVNYLPPEVPAGGGWGGELLAERAIPHPRRPAVTELTREEDYALFWSLCFAIRRQEFERVGGLDTRYFGYGAEDTDFAYSLREIRVPFYLSSAVAYHQHHPTCSPPYNRLHDIVRNAVTFRDKWGSWPMEGWLTAFRDAGLIRWEARDITILREPDAALIAGSRSDTPFV